MHWHCIFWAALTHSRHSKMAHYLWTSYGTDFRVSARLMLCLFPIYKVVTTKTLSLRQLLINWQTMGRYKSTGATLSGAQECGRNLLFIRFAHELKSCRRQQRLSQNILCWRSTINMHDRYNHYIVLNLLSCIRSLRILCHSHQQKCWLRHDKNKVPCCFIHLAIFARLRR